MLKNRSAVPNRTNSIPGQHNTPKVDGKTDHSRWRLLDEEGRQTWHYLKTDEEVKEWPQSVADKYFLGLPTVCPPFAHFSLQA